MGRHGCELRAHTKPLTSADWNLHLPRRGMHLLLECAFVVQSELLEGLSDVAHVFPCHFFHGRFHVVQDIFHRSFLLSFGLSRRQIMHKVEAMNSRNEDMNEFGVGFGYCSTFSSCSGVARRAAGESVMRPNERIKFSARP